MMFKLDIFWKHIFIHPSAESQST